MNKATIDVDPPTVEDLEGVKTLITEFVTETDSQVGKQILDSWRESAPKFVKIFPKDYKRALAEIAKEKELADAAAKDEDEVGLGYSKMMKRMK